MKNLILKWLGLDDPLLQYPQRDASDIEDMIRKYLAQAYDLDGIASKTDDMDYLTQDLESRGNRWDDMADKIEDIDMEDLLSDLEAKLDLDKIQELDDRLTELLAGYKLEVKLTQENF